MPRWLIKYMADPVPMAARWAPTDGLVSDWEVRHNRPNNAPLPRRPASILQIYVARWFLSLCLLVTLGPITCRTTLRSLLRYASPFSGLLLRVLPTHKLSMTVNMLPLLLSVGGGLLPISLWFCDVEQLWMQQLSVVPSLGCILIPTQGIF